jgi:hypothetical protein
LKKDVVVALPGLLNIPVCSENTKLGIVGVTKPTTGFSTFLKCFHSTPAVDSLKGRDSEVHLSIARLLCQKGPLRFHSSSYKFRSKLIAEQKLNPNMGRACIDEAGTQLVGFLQVLLVCQTTFSSQQILELS